VPPDVAATIDALEQTWTSLDGVLAGLSDEEWSRPTGCPGWDVHDNVSHLIGVEVGADGDPAPGHVIDTTGLSPAGVEMEPAVDYRRGRPNADLLAEFRAVTAASLARRRSADVPADRLTDGPFGWRMPYGRLLGIRVFDCYAHEQDIRRAVGRPGNLSGAAARLSWDQIGEILPGVLSGRLPEMGERPVDLVVEGFGPLRAGGEGEAVVRMTMDFGVLVAFVCGRSDAKLDSVAVSGDADLARRVLAAMGFTP